MLEDLQYLAQENSRRANDARREDVTPSRVASVGQTERR